MSNLELPFASIINPECICKGLLDDGDVQCYELAGNSGYQVIDEGSPLVAQSLADCGGLGFENITARPLKNPIYLPNFIPVITRNSPKLLAQSKLRYVAVTIDDVVSPKKLRVKPNIRERMAVPPDIKIILLCYGLDELIENIWPTHKDIFAQLRNSGIDLIAPMNYSIWHSQPHLERLINIKRSLVVYQTLQDLGFEAIPHFYFSGKTDLNRLAKWLKINHSVDLVAINLQTIDNKEQGLWLKTMQDLKYFSSLLDRPLSYLISGPQTEQRIAQVFNALGPNITFTNGTGTILALNHYAQTVKHHGMKSIRSSDENISCLFNANCQTYDQMIMRVKQSYLKDCLVHSQLSTEYINKPALKTLAEKYKTEIKNKKLNHTQSPKPLAQKTALPL